MRNGNWIFFKDYMLGGKKFFFFFFDSHLTSLTCLSDFETLETIQLLVPFSASVDEVAVTFLLRS